MVELNIAHDIDTSAKWLNECNSRINGATLDDSSRNRVSAALLHLALEHHGAIQLLISHKPYPHYGSAFALLRPQFEAYLRGVWLHCYASDQELNEFIERDKLPRIDNLINNFETCLSDASEGLLKSTREKAWKIMCDYTHGGAIQIASRISPTEINSNYSEQQIHELISGTCAITLNVAVAFASLIGDRNMMPELFLAYKKLFP